ncbi:4'-phosphopantetheinyl transferase family protein [Conchiformibius kuhniae]|uniref:4'-phosphopantetheinyl transferase family protein n=1 Tax=Conchiformibius kuhniae TaxID=211502 RepID=A0A8T9MW14_9NEIS|nr:4'-phosphopantetheinyl transferase superfamily protein [Conchiformibius kuhniae]UOP04656.1 4'-phosphopantetheinyl transferase superfamily protein [Conchiformibius kuhniae]
MDVYVAGRDCAAYYDDAALDTNDAVRVAHRPALARRDDWRVSRFLKQRVAADGRCRSLSHSGGAALLACAESVVGADLERLRPRDFRAWQDNILHPHEHIWLARHGRTLTAHYALWTLKEALLKAAGLAFADLADVGIRQHGGHWRLCADGRVWHGAVWRVGGDFAAACVWRQAGETVCWHGFGAWQTVRVAEWCGF